MATKRLMQEYKQLLRSNDFQNIVEVNFKGDNQYEWRIKFDVLKYELSKELRADFEDWAKRCKSNPVMEFEVLYSDQFPFSPPFIRVIKPRFQFRTGHVTVGGSICMESLTPSGWSSARSIESYFVEILSLLNAGNGRLEKGREDHEYSLNEAREAFNRVARDHGWL